MPDLVAYVDGGSHGNPGPSGIGVVIEHSGGESSGLPSGSAARTTTSPNTSPCWKPCNTPSRSKPARSSVYSDSEIVVKQMTGQYACHSPRLYSLNWTCRKLARSLISPSPTSAANRTAKPMRWPTARYCSTASTELRNVFTSASL